VREWVDREEVVVVECQQTEKKKTHTKFFVVPSGQSLMHMGLSSEVVGGEETGHGVVVGWTLHSVDTTKTKMEKKLTFLFHSFFVLLDLLAILDAQGPHPLVGLYVSHLSGWWRCFS
jgi:hypothetical protein